MLWRNWLFVNGWLLAGTTFLASAVESIEALTVVLAVGVACSWRTALRGAGLGFIVLAFIVVVFGPLLRFVPIGTLEVVVGTFFVLFGLSWLRKAILRYAGRKSMRDEKAAYDREVAHLHTLDERNADRVAAATAFNAVLLEGLEVAVIVVTFGTASSTALLWSALGAGVAVVLIAAVGTVLRRPASRVPENLLKFIVGVLLTSFGTFWAGEGLGIIWWRLDLSLLPLVLSYLIVSAGLIAIARARSLRTV